MSRNTWFVTYLLTCVADCLLRPMAALASNALVFKHVFPDIGHTCMAQEIFPGEQVSVITQYDISLLSDLLPFIKAECKALDKNLSSQVNYCLLIGKFPAFGGVGSHRCGTKRSLT